MARHRGRRVLPIAGAAGTTIKFRPSPARPGQEVEVSYDGPPPLLWQTPTDQGWTEIPIDPATGKGRFRVPRGTTIVVFTNERVPAFSAELLVDEPNR